MMTLLQKKFLFTTSFNRWYQTPSDCTRILQISCLEHVMVTMKLED